MSLVGFYTPNIKISVASFRYLEFKASLSNIFMIEEMVKEDKAEVQQILHEKKELEAKLAVLNAKMTADGKRKRARIISDNNRMISIYDSLNLDQVD